MELSVERNRCIRIEPALSGSAAPEKEAVYVGHIIPSVQNDGSDNGQGENVKICYSSCESPERNSG